ncbi:MAG: hypothetical protein KGL59_16430, partial [Acidobacteriota bacterium]|nr:hypothetical protein [Acidobacteriota bacterium]
MNTTPLHITAAHISQIKSPAQFVELLRYLLLAEARANEIAMRGVHVPAQLTVSDGGEDARIEWQGGRESTDYVPRRVTMFQSKATSMPKGKCLAEVKADDGTLKPAIRDVLAKGGAYVIFCTDQCTGSRLRDRLDGLEQGIREAAPGEFAGAKLEFYDANKIANWVNLHPSVQVWASEQIVGTPTAGFCSWETWSRNPDLHVSEYSFVPGPLRDNGVPGLAEIMESIAGTAAAPRSVVRVVGLSGLGKTRLVLEAFRPPTSTTLANGDLQRAALAASVLYVPAAVGRAELTRAIIGFRDRQISAVLVVDECDPDSHRQLSNIVRHADSKMSLVSLDFDLERVGDDPLVKLRPVSDEVIRSILAQAYPGLLEPDVGRITTFAQGFPLMAVGLGRDRLA